MEKLKQYWDENPLAVVGVTAAAVSAVAKLVDAVSASRGRRAYAKQVNYRVKHKR